MTPETRAEIAMCDECISHLLENAGPDHLIVKYRAALIKLQEQAEEIKRLEDALVEERARGDYFDESQECEGYWWDRKNTSDHTQNNYREMARGRLRAEGAIR